MVEFALIFPLALFVLYGAVAGSYLFFQSEAVTNAARGGSRWASIKASNNTGYLYTADVGGRSCEKASLVTPPDSIVDEIHKASNILPLNMGRLCTPVVGAGFSTTQLRQPIDSTKAYIVVDAAPSLATPKCITISVVYDAPTLPGPFPAVFTLEGNSGAPVSGSGSASCPAPFTPPSPSPSP